MSGPHSAGKGDRSRIGKLSVYQANYPFPERKTSQEWCDIHQVFVIDADGWVGCNWDIERITEAEFNARLSVSTIMHKTPDKAAQ